MWTGNKADMIQHWNGRGWHRASSESIGEYGPNFTAVTAPKANSAWAVGSYSLNNQSMFDTLTEHWDGVGWSVVTSPNRDGDSTLAGVAAIPGTNQVWAVGESEPSSCDGCYSTLIELFSYTRLPNERGRPPGRHRRLRPCLSRVPAVRRLRPCLPPEFIDLAEGSEEASNTYSRKSQAATRPHDVEHGW